MRKRQKKIFVETVRCKKKKTEHTTLLLLAIYIYITQVFFLNNIRSEFIVRVID